MNISNEYIAQRRRVRQVALAILERAKEANIPDKYSRINKDSFTQLLYPEFKNINLVADFVYNTPEKMLKKDFVVIDGGSEENRLRVGFAILFKLIISDKNGLYRDCGELWHKFQNINFNEGFNRNEIAEDLKDYDVLFIGEFDRKVFNPHFESSSFFDEILADRINNSRITIVSLVNPIEDVTKTQEEKAASGELVSSCGKYLTRLSTGKDSESIYRIRVKI